ncbi:hypothetical protein ACFSO7_15440 [Bacillus sp. CGMCC 1.16607]|uniref:hypothetical protein n=1 Tax=Bacillus sp. CGMCC 1.16607 TaxID=3351842 RepID=UPI00362CBA5C
MEKSQAITLSKLLDEWAKHPSITYELSKLETVRDQLHQFHQWSNGKPLVAGFHVAKLGINNYYFLLIDWHRNDNYYLVIYSGNKSRTLAEIQHIVEKDGKPYFHWKYNPLKRDGKNEQRKAYFKQVFGSLLLEIPLPSSLDQVEDFFDHVLMLCSNRTKADGIVEIFPLEY